MKTLFQENNAKIFVMFGLVFAAALFSVPSTSFASEAAFSKYYRAGASSAGNLGCPSGWSQIDSWSIYEGDSADGGGGTHTGLACSSSAYSAAFTKYYRTNSSNSFPPCPAGWTTVDTWAVQEGDKGDGGGGWHGGVACATNSYQSAISKYYRERSGSRPQNAWALNVDQCPPGSWTKIDSWSVYEGDGADGGGGQHDGFACVYTGSDYTKTYTKYYRTNYPPDDFPNTIPSCASGWNRIDTWGVWEGDSADGGGNWHTGVACAAPNPVGTIVMNATLDGKPYNPSFTEGYDAPYGANQTATLSLAQTFTNMQTGVYTVRSVTPPAGVTLQNINGSPLPYGATLTTGGTLTVTYNFVTAAPPSGTIIVKTVKDGVAWNSPAFTVNYTGPGGTTDATLDTDASGKQTFPGSLTGSYILNNLAVPAGVTLKDVNGMPFPPPYGQTLSAGNTITFTLDFAAVVAPPPPPPPQTPNPTLVVSPPSASVQVNGTQQFNAIYDPDGSGPQPPQDVTANGAIWHSSNWRVAVVDSSTGVATGASAGSATITANYAGLMQSATLTVTAPTPNPTLVVSPPSASVQVNGTQQFNAIYDPDGSGPQPPQDVTANGAIWHSSNWRVAVVDSSTGVATGASAGSATITANYAGLMQSATLTVTAPTPTFVIAPHSANVPVGGNQQFTAMYDPDGSGPNAPQDVTASAAWSSSDTTKVTVSGGLASRIGHGLVSVSASYAGLTDSATVLDPATLRISPLSASLKSGDTVQLSALYDPDGASGSQPSQDVTASSGWGTNIPAIASIDNTSSKGLVTAGGTPGTAVISAVYAGLAATSRIFVAVPPSSSSLSVSCSAAPTSVMTGHTVTWTATVSGGTGSYSYSWSGSSPLGGQTGNPVSVTYATAGTKTGSVVVTSGSQTVSQVCSSSVSVAGAPSAPTVPSNLRVDSASLQSCGAIRLTWTDTAHNEDRFELERNSGSGFANVANPSANATSYTDTTIAQNSAYSYRIRACNAFGCSAYSNIASGSNQSPSVDFTWVPAIPVVNHRTNFAYRLLSGGPLNSWAWRFAGGNPSASTTPNPYSVFSAQGQHAVQLTVAGVQGVCTISHLVAVSQVTTGDWCELPPDAPPGMQCP